MWYTAWGKPRSVLHTTTALGGVVLCGIQHGVSQGVFYIRRTALGGVVYVVYSMGLAKECSTYDVLH